MIINYRNYKLLLQDNFINIKEEFRGIEVFRIVWYEVNCTKEMVKFFAVDSNIYKNFVGHIKI